MATEANKRELVEKVAKLVANNFGGSWKHAFGFYASAAAGMDSTDIVRVLSDAGIGNVFTRGKWADAIMAEIDRDRDGFISEAEFQAMFVKLPDP